MNPIYLDYAATTPADSRVVEAMLPFFTENFGNAASRQHVFGKSAEEAVEQARLQVAGALGADPREIVWTSGATESDNLALKGVAHAPYYASRGNHIVTVATEHKAVLDTCDQLEAEGIGVTYLPVDSGGGLDLGRLADAIEEKTILVSVMHANNEIGTLHPIREIGRLCRDRGVLFHTDATQSFGKQPIDVEADCIDLLSLSAHKIYGPKGVGALYVRRKGPRVRCIPLIHGGGHERGLRSGTLNVPGIVGLGKAAELAVEDLDCEPSRPTSLLGGEGAEPVAFPNCPLERERIRTLRDRLETALMERLDGVARNGNAENRLAGITNLNFAGVNAEKVMALMPRVAVSSSAACTSAARQPSYVLAALGHDASRIDGSIRFSLGRFTTREEIDAAVEEVVRAVTLAREGASAEQSESSEPKCSIE